MTARKGRNGDGEPADRDALIGLTTWPCYAMRRLNTGIAPAASRFVHIQTSLCAAN